MARASLLLLAAAAPARAGRVELASGFVLEDDVAAPPAPTSELASVFYSTSELDNIVGASAAIKAFAAQHKAGDADFNERPAFFAAATAGKLPLKSYWSDALHDTLTTASAAGQAWAAEPANGYKLLQVEGYCESTPAPGAKQLLQYWSAARNDSFLVLAGGSHEATAKAAGYVQKFAECFAAPPPPVPTCRAGTDCGGTGEWVTWADKPPTPSYSNPGTIPFPKSKDMSAPSTLPRRRRWKFPPS